MGSHVLVPLPIWNFGDLDAALNACLTKVDSEEPQSGQLPSIRNTELVATADDEFVPGEFFSSVLQEGTLH